MANDDRPGVIGDVGTARPPRRQHRQLRAGPRRRHGAVGVITVDEGGLEAAVKDVRGLKAIREATIARV